MGNVDLHDGTGHRLMGDVEDGQQARDVDQRDRRSVTVLLRFRDVHTGERLRENDVGIQT